MTIINYLCFILHRTIYFIAPFIISSEKNPQWQNSMMYTSVLLPLNFATSQILTSVFTFPKITLLPLYRVCPCNNTDLKKKKEDFSYFSLIWLISISLIQSSKRVGPLLGVSAQGLQWNNSKNIYLKGKYSSIA